MAIKTRLDDELAGLFGQEPAQPYGATAPPAPAAPGLPPAIPSLIFPGSTINPKEDGASPTMQYFARQEQVTPQMPMQAGPDVVSPDPGSPQSSLAPAPTSPEPRNSWEAPSVSAADWLRTGNDGSSRHTNAVAERNGQIQDIASARAELKKLHETTTPEARAAQMAVVTNALERLRMVGIRASLTAKGELNIDASTVAPAPQTGQEQSDENNQKSQAVTAAMALAEEIKDGKYKGKALLAKKAEMKKHIAALRKADIQHTYIKGKLRVPDFENKMTGKWAGNQILDQQGQEEAERTGKPVLKTGPRSTFGVTPHAIGISSDSYYMPKLKDVESRDSTGKSVTLRLTETQRKKMQADIAAARAAVPGKPGTKEHDAALKVAQGAIIDKLVAEQEQPEQAKPTATPQPGRDQRPDNGYVGGVFNPKHWKAKDQAAPRKQIEARIKTLISGMGKQYYAGLDKATQNEIIRILQDNKLSPEARMRKIDRWAGDLDSEAPEDPKVAAARAKEAEAKWEKQREQEIKPLEDDYKDAKAEVKSALKRLQDDERAADSIVTVTEDGKPHRPGVVAHERAQDRIKQSQELLDQARKAERDARTALDASRQRRAAGPNAEATVQGGAGPLISDSPAEPSLNGPGIGGASLNGPGSNSVPDGPFSPVYAKSQADGEGKAALAVIVEQANAAKTPEEFLAILTTPSEEAAKLSSSDVAALKARAVELGLYPKGVAK